MSRISSLSRHRPPHRPHEGARLFARPARQPEVARAETTIVEHAVAAGLHHLELEQHGRDGLLYVPESVNLDDRSATLPLVLLLHGAGGNASHGIALLQNLADESGVLLLAPDSRGRTWDVIMNDYGADIEFINAALEQVFANHPIDAARVAVGGFSDGASYALSLGLTNGDLFSHVLAFAPGFMAPTADHGGPGSPRVYISHGTDDRVLPIDRCSRRLVPQLQSAGYHVLYREFDGPHTVPPDLAREALDWFLSSPGS